MKDCSQCGRKKELRPYGKGGVSICFDCAMATPESQAETERQFKAALDDAGPLAAVGDDRGVHPMTAEELTEIAPKVKA